MYNCTKHHTGMVVARVTKDRAARPHLPSTVENQLGRRRQLLTIAQRKVRTLLDREAADRPERRTALVVMELANYNIDTTALCETSLSCSSRNNLLSSFRVISSTCTSYVKLLVMVMPKYLRLSVCSVDTYGWEVCPCFR